ALGILTRTGEGEYHIGYYYHMDTGAWLELSYYSENGLITRMEWMWYMSRLKNEGPANNRRFSLLKKSLGEFERAAALSSLIILATCAFAPATLKACPVFRGCGVLSTVLAPSAHHFAAGRRNKAKIAFSKEQIFDLRLKMLSPPRLRPIRPRTALTLVRGYALCGALRAVLKG
ncbi:MAG: hypothetical protein SOW46_06900, partial [Candidatus Aphodomonas sp.]|nr:hypothetical protein [Candidatus Aphodomonas sp.]